MTAWMAALGELIAQLSLAYLDHYLSRKDLIERTRLEVANRAYALAVKAMEWKANAAVSPNSGSGMHDAGGTIQLQGGPPSPGGPPT